MRNSPRRANAASCYGIRLTVSAMLLLTNGLSVHAQTGSVAKGQAIFESRCVACHSLDANRVGPALGTVWGRVAGKAPDFEYSRALAQATHVWSKDKLMAWLENPEMVVPGQEMGYRVEHASDRLNVVAFLASLTQHKTKK